MDEHYLHVDLIGKLWIDEVFVYYDEPLMFSCINMFKQEFLANCIDGDDEKREWLILPISKPRLLHAMKGNISVRSLFTQPEGEFLWRVEEYFDQKKATARQILATELSDDELPTEDAYLKCNIVKTELKDNRNIMPVAQQEQRNVLDISLELDDGHSHEISPEVLGKTLNMVQNLVYSIAHKTGGSNSSLPKSILEDNQLSVVSTYAASFGIRLKSKDIANLFGVTKVQESLCTLVELLKCKDNSNQLKSVLEGLSPKVGLKYKALLNTLVKSNMGVKTYLANPDNTYDEVFLSSNEIKSSLTILESEIRDKSTVIEYEGELVGADVDSNTFTFIPVDDRKISGKIAENINIRSFTIPVKTKIKVEERIEINSLTKKEQISNTLLEVIKDVEKSGN